MGYLRLHRVTGRFFRHHNLSSLWRRAVGVDGRPAMVSGTRCVLGPAPLDESVRELRENGYCTGYRLPATASDEILRFARVTPCRHADDDPERFLIAEVANGHSPKGRPVAVADVEMRRCCPAIKALGGDELLVETARNFLGYAPRSCDLRLFWSPAARLPEQVRRSNGQTIDFHYDIDPSRSLYFFFYITPTDRDSGSHVVLPRSHRRKPLPIVLSSCFQPEWRLDRVYGGLQCRIIEGGPGFGFAEDPACFHKALVPRTGPRLVLQLRYS